MFSSPNGIGLERSDPLTCHLLSMSGTSKQSNSRLYLPMTIISGIITNTICTSTGGDLNNQQNKTALIGISTGTPVLYSVH